MKKHSYNFKDLTGQKFGRLTVLALDNCENGKARWLCKCDCGKKVSVSRNCLTSGNTKSCGCYKDSLNKTRTLKHGMANTRIYKIWIGMRKRCNNPKDSNFNLYGGRGIIVCKDWQEDFWEFYDWAMKHGYQENLSIDRVDVDGNYEPNNCRWITQAEQTRNVRTNVKITIKGETKLLNEWAKESGIDRRTITKRIKMGWSNDELLKPVNKTKEAR